MVLLSVKISKTSGASFAAGKSNIKIDKKNKQPQLPGPTKGCFLEVFGYIKATKKQPFGGAGLQEICVDLFGVFRTLVPSRSRCCEDGRGELVRKASLFLTPSRLNFQTFWVVFLLKMTKTRKFFYFLSGGFTRWFILITSDFLSWFWWSL